MSVYRRDGLPWLSVFLRSAAGAVELSTVDDSTGYKLLDGVKGLGIPARSVESTPIPAGHGSVFRSQRFDESEVLLPISVKGLGPDRMAELRRGLEQVLLVDRDEPAELIVQAPGLGTVRRRFVYYTEGLEGALGGADSHLEWNHIALRLLALDPMWWGAEQSETFRVKPARKPFLSRVRDGSPGQEDVQGVPFFPIMLSASTIQGARQIYIQGDADAYPTWTVHGPGGDFGLINWTTGERFFLEGEITSPVTIDSRTEQLSAEGMSNMELWARVPRELSTFPLRPGRNDISFVIVNATEQSRVELRYSEQWRAGY